MKRIGCGVAMVLFGVFLIIGAFMDSPTALGIVAMAGIAGLFLIAPGAFAIYSGTPWARKHWAAAQPEASDAQRRKGELDPDDAVIELLQLYGATREGFYPSSSGASETRVRDIGRQMDAQGGKELMREVHSKFARMTNTPGGARNLEIMWDGIGSWQG